MARIPLEPEQEQLFFALVEAVRSVPRSQREDFSFIAFGQGSLVEGNGLQDEVLGSDVQHLATVGLVEVGKYHTRGSGFNFYLPPGALSYYGELKQQSGDPVEQVETEIRSYLQADSFRAAHPTAYSRWAEAVDLLWSADSERELSTIGHKCREAIQEFTTSLVDRDRPDPVNQDKAMTRDRLSAVLNAHRPQLGETRSALLDAMFGYWRALGDVVQRQEHAGQREREPLDWEDGRRVVFQTAVVMFEIDRAL
jgi:hypothetical protein